MSKKVLDTRPAEQETTPAGNQAETPVPARSESTPASSQPSSHVAFRAGYVAIVGQPNVGKSTLLNSLLQFKLSIVSPKPQTTRRQIRGILNRPGCQMVLFDTPGLLEPNYRLQQAFVRTAYAAMKEASVQLFMIEPEPAMQAMDVEILKRLADTGRPIVVAINKIDRTQKELLLPIIAALKDRPGIAEIVPISALNGEGINLLVEVLEKLLPFHEPYYPTDQITDHPERFLAAEIVREKIFLRYGEEIPFSTSVRVDEFIERPGHKDFIRAVIYVERESQKGILIGRGGSALKQVGKMAREEIESMIGRPVYLELYVSVKEKWRDREQELRNLGYL